MQKTIISKDWYFKMDGAAGFTNIDLPHDYAVTIPRNKDIASGEYLGYFTAPGSTYIKYLKPEENCHYILDVDGSYMCTAVYFNEVHMTLHPYGYSPFLVDLTGRMRIGKTNKLLFTLNPMQLSTRWYTGAGVYRDVYLWTGGDIRVEPWDLFITTPEANQEEATVNAAYTITADYDASIVVKTTILDAEGKPVAFGEQSLDVAKGANKADLTLKVNTPHLWDTVNPYLYSMHTEIFCDGKVTDTADNSFGIRTIAFSAAKGFQLNGVTMKMKGGCIHHDHGVLGAADFPAAVYRKLSKLKAAGYNAIRSSHNHPSLQLLEACDKLGILVMDEAFDCWNRPKGAFGYNLWFDDWYERDLTAMVKRDRNHPCVMSYSTANEIKEHNGTMEGEKLTRRLRDVIRSHDSTRPVTGAIFANCPSTHPTDPADYVEDFNERFFSQHPDDPFKNWGYRTAASYAEMDICGYNYLYDRYAYDHERFPERIIWGSETVVINFYESWKATMENDHVIGDFTWTAYDNMGEVGAGRSYWARDGLNPPFLASYPWRSCYQGDFNLIGVRRPQSYFRESIWVGNTEPRIFTTHPEHYGEEFGGTGWHWYDVLDSWTFADKYLGKPVKCEVYTDADEVEWFLNGRSLGKSTPEKMIATFDINYEKGEVSVIAYKNGAECGRSSLHTVGAPAKVVITPEVDSIAADNRDLCYFDIQITDEKGDRIPDAKNELTCLIEGGELMGIFSGDPANEDQYGSNKCHAFEGSAVAVVRTKNPGQVSVIVGAVGLASGKASVTAK